MIAAGIGFAAAKGAKETETEKLAVKEPETEEPATVPVTGIAEAEGQEADQVIGLHTEPAEEPETVQVENPSWDYYIEVPVEAETKPLELTVLEQTQNQITDEERWFAENELELPDRNDEGYQCIINAGLMSVDVLKDGELKATLDFSEYQYADDFLPEDQMFIDQEIHSAVVREGILYVSTFHYTYAESSPHTGYITAVSLENYHVLWKTEPLTCNSLNFEITGDVILCGYGFTAEDDYLYQLDKNTGKRIGQTPLASKPDYIIYKDGRLFVRTYHTDYVFQAEG